MTDDDLTVDLVRWHPRYRKDIVSGPLGAEPLARLLASGRLVVTRPGSSSPDFDVIGLPAAPEAPRARAT